jgi:hypothetical protein
LPAAPILAIARAELRRGWRTLVLVGLVAGLMGGTVTGALALARRTFTAYERLGERTVLDDARGMVLGHDRLVEEIVSLPEVTDRWTGRVGVAQLEDSFTYLGITAGPEEPSPLLRPIVLEGRLPAAADGDVIEVALRDDFQREFHVAMGTELTARFLTQDDYFRFDSGFAGGHPNGPTLTIRVVGTVRVAGGSTTLPPGFASPAALRDHPEAFGPGATWFVRLDGGQRSFEAFRAAVDDRADGLTLPPEAAEFVVASVSDPQRATASAQHTADLLGRALLALAAAAAAAGLLAVAQGLTRHQAGGAGDQQVESALGLTSGQRRAARLLVGAVPAAGAVLLTAVGAAIGSRIEPIGAIANYEPSPGPALNVAAAVTGVLLSGALVLVLSVVATALAGRRRIERPARESTLVARTAGLGGGPSGVTGLRFALEPGHGARAVPVRSALLGLIVGVAGVVSGIVYTVSLDRLAGSDTRSGIPFDIVVSDVRAADVQALLDDPDVGTVVAVDSAGLQLDGLDVSGHALTAHRGSLPIDLTDGRLPRTPDEATLGLRLAADLGKGVGDTVTAVDAAGERRELAVVGTGVVPVFEGEQLGLNAIVTEEGLDQAAVSRAFAEAVVRARPGADVDALTERLAADREAGPPSVPPEVGNLRELGRLPAAVATLVGAVGVLGLANALVVLVRRRRRDLALLRTIGFTSRQSTISILVMATTIVTIGLFVGIPLGIAFGSSMWRLTAAGAFVATDSLVRWPLLGAVAGAALMVGLVAAALPARRASRMVPAELLRTE